MPLAQCLQEFASALGQCDSLVSTAHRLDNNSSYIFSALSRQQITTAAFLNMFVAWEGFLETSLSEFMIGTPTLGGTHPTRFVAPPDAAAAKAIVVGTRPFFDYGNHEFVRRIVHLYFQNGYPYEPPLSAIFEDLKDLRVMRNWSAHISSTTQAALEGVAFKLFTRQRLGVRLYDILTTADRRSPGDTIFAAYMKRLLVTAELIVNG